MIHLAYLTCSQEITTLDRPECLQLAPKLEVVALTLW